MNDPAAPPKVPELRRRLLKAAQALTTPLLPDDYLGMIDRRWSLREATGSIVAVRPETDEASTIVIRPGRTWGGHAPGQYLRVGAEIDGVRHWRAYSITSDPGRLVSITVKRVEHGLMSGWLVDRARPGTPVLLGGVEGTFGLPEPLPAKILSISAGSGVTPVMSLLRELDRRGAVNDVVHVHSVRRAGQFIFGDALRELAARRPGYVLHERLTSDAGRLGPAALDALVPDWRERTTFLSGPPAMLDAFEAHHREHGRIGSRLYVERFQPATGDAAAGGAGGIVTFRHQAVEAGCDGGVSILAGGERAGARLPSGCRMGICHTCVGRLVSGRVRDLRTGELSVAQGQAIRTCVNAPEGPVVLSL